MFLLRTLLCLLLLPLPVVAQSGDLLTLTFSREAPGSARIYGTTTQKPVAVLSVNAGQQVILQQQQGRDYQLQASPWAYAGTQVQQVAREATSIVVTPELDGDTVSLQLSYHERDADDEMAYSSTVSGKLGQWIPLLQGDANSSTQRGKVWQAGNNTEPLAVKVELAR